MGKLLGIARRKIRRAPLELVESAEITVDAGVEGIYGDKPAGRKVTLIAREAWEATCSVLGVDIPWQTRRANLLVEGVEFRESKGAYIRIGEVVLEITGETTPCGLMERLHPGLLEALVPDWRGGVVCRVIEPGQIQIGDTAELAADRTLAR